MSKRPPINGLILAGGKSQRMGRDKASLRIHQCTMIERTEKLIAPFCNQVYLSIRADQTFETPLKTIRDSHGEIGPMGGILSAFSFDTRVAWLVVACDLPLLVEAVIAELFKERKCRDFPVTYFYDSSKNFPEPLCAIYEPDFQNTMLAHCKQQQYSLNRTIKASKIPGLCLPQTQALENMNTPEDYERLKIQANP